MIHHQHSSYLVSSNYFLTLPITFLLSTNLFKATNGYYFFLLCVCLQREAPQPENNGFTIVLLFFFPLFCPALPPMTSLHHQYQLISFWIHKFKLNFFSNSNNFFTRAHPSSLSLHISFIFKYLFLGGWCTFLCD